MTGEVEARETVGGVIDQVGIDHHSRFPVITPLFMYIGGLWYLPYWVSRFQSQHWVVSNVIIQWPAGVAFNFFYERVGGCYSSEAGWFNVCQNRKPWKGGRTEGATYEAQSGVYLHIYQVGMS